METSVRQWIQHHYKKLPRGTPFTTRDVLGYGLRAAIDQALARLVKNGILRRLARGVFVYDPENKRTFSIWEIAKIKAESFQRKIFPHPSSTLRKLNRLQTKEEDVVFNINARSSKFRIGSTTIHFKEICERKAALSEVERVGEKIKTIWWVGRKNFDGLLLKEAMQFYGGSPTSALRRRAFLMPCWLSDIFLKVLPRFRVAHRLHPEKTTIPVGVRLY